MKKTITLALLGFFLSVGYFSATSLAEYEDLKTPEVHTPATGAALEIFKTLGVDDSFHDRSPASLGKRKVAVQGQKSTSSLPKEIKTGFEIRVHYKGISHTYWVMERGNQFDFAYANSTGSRATPSLTREDFAALYKSAENVPPVNKVIVAKCPKANIMIFVREDGKRERASAGCAEGRDKTSQQLQILTNWLLSRL